MSNWINSNIINGVPPDVDNYVAIINDLEANCVYEYRAYARVGDEIIYGDTRVGVTKPPIPKIPIVVTGTATDITTVGMKLATNIVTDIGSSNIIEYGVLYTQSQTYGTNSKLIYENSGTFIKKRGVIANIDIDTEFLVGGYGVINDLQMGRVTYYRAYAKNNEGIGYGEIKNLRTLSN